MPKTQPIRTFASATVLALAIAQPTWAQSAPATGQTTADGAQAPAAETQPSPEAAKETAAPKSGPEAARARAEQHRAAMEAERDKRYAELRASAARLGVDMSETPPWKAAEGAMPRMPAPPPLPEGYGRPSPEEREARLQQRESIREEHWKRMQAEAAARGMDGPESAPWEDMEKRRQEMAERIEQYRKTVEQMSEAQREAAQAVFGGAPAMPYPPMPQGDYGHSGWSHPCPISPYGMPQRPMMPSYHDMPGYDQGPPPPPAKRDAD